MQFKLNFQTQSILRGVCSHLFTDASVEPVDSFFEGQ
jgi:hypothetical protein